MKDLLPLAEKIAQRLIARRETIAVAESSTGGLVAAALLAVPGASAYFLGGAVVYTKAARAALLGIGDADMQGFRPASEAYALLLARRMRERHGAAGASARPAPPARPATATAIRPATPASASPGRWSARSRCAPAAPSGSPT